MYMIIINFSRWGQKSYHFKTIVFKTVLSPNVVSWLDLSNTASYFFLTLQVHIIANLYKQIFKMKNLVACMRLV